MLDDTSSVAVQSMRAISLRMTDDSVLTCLTA